MAGLYGPRRRRQDSGAVIDAPLYGSVLRILEWTLAAYDRLGTVRGREGNRLKVSAPLDNYLAGDGVYVCVVAGSDANFARLCQAMGAPTCVGDPRFATLADRARHGDEINATVADWVGSLPSDEVEQRCVAADVPVGTRLQRRRHLRRPPHGRAGRPGDGAGPGRRPDPPTSPLPPARRQGPGPPTGAPRLGQHNEEVWCDLVGLSGDELRRLPRPGRHLRADPGAGPAAGTWPHEPTR